MIHDRTFIIDSNDLGSVTSRLYGYMVTDDGNIYIDEIPDTVSDTGMFILIQKTDSTLSIKQDFLSSFGLFLYRKGHRFCISNSLFRLAEYTKGQITPNKAAARELAACPDVPMSTGETLVREIRRLKSNESIQIDLSSGKLTVLRREYTYYRQQLDSVEAFRKLDSWYYKWTRVFRNLMQGHFPVQADLSGGLDTRLILSMLRNGNIDISAGIEYHTHPFVNLEKDKEDHRIALEIASDLDLELNKPLIPRSESASGYSAADVYDDCKYTSFGRSVMSKYTTSLYESPMFTLKGLGSTTKGGFWKRVDSAVEGYASSYLDAFPARGVLAGLRNRLKRYMLRFHFRRKVTLILEGYSHTEAHCATLLYKKLKMENRDAGKAMDWMAADQFIISPFIDPVLSGFDYDPGDRDILYLNALILDRYDPELLRFPVEGRAFRQETLTRVHELNQQFPLTKPDFTAIGGTPSEIKVTPVKRSDLSQFFTSLCNNEEFTKKLSRFIRPEYVEKVLRETDFEKMSFRKQSLNGLLAVFELLNIT